ncbi:MAG: hypothetical protein R3231_10885, partial [bacterium]|nr:hypothetical protein [bacterium]
SQKDRYLHRQRHKTWNYGLRLPFTEGAGPCLDLRLIVLLFFNIVNLLRDHRHLPKGFEIVLSQGKKHNADDHSKKKEGESIIADETVQPLQNLENPFAQPLT